MRGGMVVDRGPCLQGLHLRASSLHDAADGYGGPEVKAAATHKVENC